MLRTTTVVRESEMAGRPVSDSLTLDRAARFRRRVVMATDGGQEILLDLAEATYLAHGDGLLLETGALVAIVAAAETLLEIRAGDVTALARIAWHIGNRHAPAEMTAQAIYIQPDHVLEEMVAGLGAEVHRVVRPFEPEGGAYGGKGPLERGHHHPHGGEPSAHDHSHGLAGAARRG